jgi:RNA polymerase sigma-70 factor, ECF subfamily
VALGTATLPDSSLRSPLPTHRPGPRAGASAATPAFRAELLTLLPSLRAFAITLCWDPVDADDLVQTTILRGLSKSHLYAPGTNMRAWLMTIMRREFYSDLRRYRLEVEDVEGKHAASVGVPAQQGAGLAMTDLERALGLLPPEQREALMLVGAAGHSYDEVAVLCGVPVGTIKSRVHRARRMLGEELDLHDASDLNLNA